MITTLSPMPRSPLRWLIKAAIIGSALLLAALLGGCSTLRLAYNSAPSLTWWWIDAYLDFSGEQQPRAKESLERWFDWHRATQLNDYAAWLQSIEPKLSEPLTADAACGLLDQLRAQLLPAFDRAYQHAAELVPQLGSTQLKALEAKYAKNNAEFRKDYLQVAVEDRRRRSVKRTVERFEQLYGTLDEPQRRVIEAAVVASPFDPQLSLADREQRQGQVLVGLKRWIEQRPELPSVVAQMRQLALDAETPKDPALRAYQQRMAAHGCRLTADVHNSTSPAQRAAARKRLQEWQGDLRSLAAQRKD